MMDISALPDSSRLWVLPFSKDVEANSKIIVGVESFLEKWRAHGAQMTAGAQLIDSRILIVAADEDGAKATGCSIDTLNREISALCQDEGVEILTGATILYRGGAGWQLSLRQEFQKLIDAGQVSADTDVVDMTVTNLGDFRLRGVVKKLAESWHAKVYTLV
jgi:hypothetical protein